MSLAPIILFVYKRPDHTKKIIESLMRNILADESELYIYSDNAGSPNDMELVNQVRNYTKTINGFKKITIKNSEKHLGLAASVITGVTEIINVYQKAIILEDDLIVAPGFLIFMNKALDFYQNNFKIFSISGYSFPIKIPKEYQKDFYIFSRASSWGWATWLNRWEKADWEIKDFESFKFNKAVQMQFNLGGNDLSYMLMAQKYGYINSWAVRWSYAHFKNNAYCLYPVLSRVKNIGFDNTATHKVRTLKFENEINYSEAEIKFSNDLEINKQISSQLNNLLKLSLLRKIINYFKYYIIK